MASALNWSDCLEYVALSDVGMRRANNQDSHKEVLSPDVDTWRLRGHMFVVCDGMGAHAAGELASEMAAEGIPHTYLKLREQPPPDALRKSIVEANAQIHRRGQANSEFQGMGTTASTLVLLPQGALVAHVGDSRIYRQRGKQIEQLTFDHSLVWEMSAAGQVSKDAIPNFVPKNIITRSLGPHPSVQVDLEGPFPLEPGDVFLLCSDGLTGQVKDEELGAILQALPPKEAAQVLIDLANLRGGPDNITITIVRIASAAITPAGGLQAEPLAITNETKIAGQHKPGKTLFLLSAVCVAAAVGLGVANLLLPAVGAGVLGVGLGLIGVVRRIPPSGPDLRYLPPGIRLGRGPHVSLVCEPNEKLVADLAAILNQLRDAATQESWSLDWGKFNQHGRQGEEAGRAADYPRAVREYATAMRFMMNELRNQRARRRQADSDEDVLGR